MIIRRSRGVGAGNRNAAEEQATASTETVGTIGSAEQNPHSSPSPSLPLPLTRQEGSRRHHPHRDGSTHDARIRREADSFGRPRRLGSVQQNYVSAVDVIGNVLVLDAYANGHARRTNHHATAHEYRAILEINSVNYALKTEGEQEAILAGYRAFLNGLTFPVQILVQVQRLDLTPYFARFQAACGACASRGVQPPAAGPCPEENVGAGADSGSVVTETVWARLAQDEVRYVQALAGQRMLLERHFYLVIPADEATAHSGTHQSRAESASMHNAAPRGLRLSEEPSRIPSQLLPRWLLPGRSRRQRSSPEAELAVAENQLALRAESVARELERLGLEARRLADAELAAVYHRAVAPDAAKQFPLSDTLSASASAGQVASLAAGDDERDGPTRVQTPALSTAANASHDRRSPDSPGTLRSGEEDGGGLRHVAVLAAESICPAAASTALGDGDLADLLAPSSVTLTRDDVRLDDTFCRTLAVVGYPRHVYAGWLERLIDLDEPLDVVLHIHPQSSAAMIRQLSHRLVQLHSSRLLNEERGRVGHPELGVAYRDVERMRERLQRGDERIFATSLYFHMRAPAVNGTGTAGDHREIDDRVARVETALANQQLVARPATFEQDLALLSCLPEGRDRLLRTRLLDTSSLATAFPFVSNSLSMPGGILLGTTTNGSPVFMDPFAPELENANKVVFAKSGAGKSYACKIEALRSLLRGTDVYVVDPEAEYGPLAEAVNGQTVRLAAGAEQHLNPFDLPLPPGQANTTENSAESGDVASVGRDLLAEKVQSLHALLELLLADRSPAGTVSLSQREKGLLDRALYEVYRRVGISSNPATHVRPAPLLRDLYDVLVGEQCGADETRLAERLYRYVRGSLSRLFAAPTNVELSNRLVVFDVRDLDAELRPLGLFLIAEFVWTRIRRERRPRLLVIDEAWTLTQYQEGGRFLAGLARRARKYYLGLITITQDAQDFLSSEHGRTVLANSSVQLLMKQDSSTIDAVSKAFRLSTGERQYLLGCHKGEGLLFARGGHVALQIGASPFEHELATTDPRELAARERAARTTAATRALPAEQGKQGTRAARSGRASGTPSGLGQSSAPHAEHAPSARARARRTPAAEQAVQGRRDRHDAQTMSAGTMRAEVVVDGAADDLSGTAGTPPGMAAECLAAAASGHEVGITYEHSDEVGVGEDGAAGAARRDVAVATTTATAEVPADKAAVNAIVDAVHDDGTGR